MQISNGFHFIEPWIGSVLGDICTSGNHVLSPRQVCSSMSLKLHSYLWFSEKSSDAGGANSSSNTSLHQANVVNPTQYRFSSAYIKLFKNIHIFDKETKQWWGFIIKWACSVPVYIDVSLGAIIKCGGNRILRKKPKGGEANWEATFHFMYPKREPLIKSGGSSCCSIYWKPVLLHLLSVKSQEPRQDGKKIKAQTLLRTTHLSGIHSIFRLRTTHLPPPFPATELRFTGLDNNIRSNS